jgi:phosphotransferase system  glucose/maltose/N-acetylglucosamine-specific IIC component
MAVLLGIFLAKLLSIAGIGGFISGLFIKRWPMAAGVGVTLGVIDTLVLASMRYTGVAPISWIMAIFVAVLTATLGWWLRGRKRP